MLHHVVQHDMFHEFGFHTLRAALIETNAPYTIVKIVPFSHELTWHEGLPIPDGDVPTMVWGMTCVEELTARVGWKPGVFKNANFDVRVLTEKYGEHLLNSDGKFYKFSEIPEFEGTAFIRPVHDTKSFTGELINGEDFKKWQQAIVDLKREYATLTWETMVQVASPKRLLTEARFFVVDDQVVTGSTYRVDSGRGLRRRIGVQNPMYLPLQDFAQQMVNRWAPCEAFVMDIAQVPDGYRVIEINCLNSSGFYDSDMAAVVRAIEGMRR